MRKGGGRGGGGGEEQYYLVDSFGRRQIEAVHDGDEIREDVR